MLIDSNFFIIHTVSSVLIYFCVCMHLVMLIMQNSGKWLSDLTIKSRPSVKATLRWRLYIPTWSRHSVNAKRWWRLHMPNWGRHSMNAKQRWRFYMPTWSRHLINANWRMYLPTWNNDEFDGFGDWFSLAVDHVGGDAFHLHFLSLERFWDRYGSPSDARLSWIQIRLYRNIRSGISIGRTPDLLTNCIRFLQWIYHQISHRIWNVKGSVSEMSVNQSIFEL